MKIDGVVVLYHPTEENVRNILKYAPVVETLFVMDNSDVIDDKLRQEFEKQPNVKFVSMGGNQGIAKALRIGTENAINDGADFCLTMDQDSIFPVDRMDDIKQYLTREDIDDYGVIGVNINSDDQEKKLVEFWYWITSGNFINLKNYKKIYGFRDELFIDAVDTDLYHQFYKIGKKVAYINEISMVHTIGSPAVKKFLGIKICTLLNHSPLRYYYRYRNNLFLYKQDKKFYKTVRFYDKKQYIKILLFEKNKREKLKMIRLGIRHAKQGKLGKLVVEPKKK